MFAIASSARFRASFAVIVLACGSLIAVNARLFAQSTAEPFMVYVDQEGVAARCGPGGDFYRTDPLRHGQALEVYVETADGWLGVRPPAGSFCWLPAEVVQLAPGQDRGVVTEENALAWIGTHLGKANKYLWQVQLSKGEEVAILGRAQRDGPDGPKLWFRIVPPAGEFRWVHREQIVENPELLLREKPRANSRVAAAQPTLAPQVESYPEPDNEPRIEQSVLEPEPTLPLPTPPVDRVASAATAPIRPASTRSPAGREVGVSDIIGSGIRQDANAFEPSADNEIARPYDAPLMAFTTRPFVKSIGGRDEAPVTPIENLTDSFDRRNAPRQSIAATSPPVSPTVQQQFVDSARVSIQPTVMPVSNVGALPSTTLPMASAGEIRSIDSLQLELSRLMARSAAGVDVEPVLSAAALLARSAPLESDRQRATLIVQRAQQYQQVAHRRDGQPLQSAIAMPASVGYPEPIQATLPAPVQSSGDAAQEVAGYLVQVFSARPDSPPFALTDQQGRTIYYVSPAPGVNLRRYLNQFISVHGTASFTTGLDTPHIIATGAIRTAE